MIFFTDYILFFLKSLQLFVVRQQGYLLHFVWVGECQGEESLQFRVDVVLEGERFYLYCEVGQVALSLVIVTNRLRHRISHVNKHAKMDHKTKYSDYILLAINNFTRERQSDHPRGTVKFSSSCQKTDIIVILQFTWNLVILDCSIHGNCIIAYDHQEYQCNTMFNEEIEYWEPCSKKKKLLRIMTERLILCPDYVQTAFANFLFWIDHIVLNYDFSSWSACQAMFGSEIPIRVEFIQVNHIIVLF